jgi:hypothetical protein
VIATSRLEEHEAYHGRDVRACGARVEKQGTSVRERGDAPRRRGRRAAGLAGYRRIGIRKATGRAWDGQPTLNPCQESGTRSERLLGWPLKR